MKDFSHEANNSSPCRGGFCEFLCPLLESRTVTNRIEGFVGRNFLPPKRPTVREGNQSESSPDGVHSLLAVAGRRRHGVALGQARRQRKNTGDIVHHFRRGGLPLQGRFRIADGLAVLAEHDTSKTATNIRLAAFRVQPQRLSKSCNAAFQSSEKK